MQLQELHVPEVVLRGTTLRRRAAAAAAAVRAPTRAAQCFASGEYCNGCNCARCFNNRSNDELRKAAIEATLERNPHAFRPKIATASSADADAKHVKGCHCKKSNCLKKYCECFQAHIVCSDKCKCIECRNAAGSSERERALVAPRRGHSSIGGADGGDVGDGGADGGDGTLSAAAGDGGGDGGGGSGGGGGTETAERAQAISESLRPVSQDNVADELLEWIGTVPATSRAKRSRRGRMRSVNGSRDISSPRTLESPLRSALFSNMPPLDSVTPAPAPTPAHNSTALLSSVARHAALSPYAEIFSANGGHLIGHVTDCLLLGAEEAAPSLEQAARQSPAHTLALQRNAVLSEFRGILQQIVDLADSKRVIPRPPASQAEETTVWYSAGQEH